MAQYSDLKVYPTTWEKSLKTNLTKDWEIRYTYYSVDHPKGKVIRFKGMNRAKTLEEKREITKALIEIEISNLEKGFNPITKQFDNLPNEVSESTPFGKALEIAHSKLKVSASMDRMIGDALVMTKPIMQKYGYYTKHLADIRKRDIKIVLDDLSKIKSNDRTNKVRACLIILFNYFVDLDIFEFNFITSIKKLVHVPAKRKILRDSDKKKFAELKKTNYKLWRFCTMFYYSGSRLEEFIQVNLSDIDLPNSKFKIFEKKGRQYHWVWKPINNNSLPLWTEIINEASKTKPYLFGNDLTPSDKHTQRDYVTDKWKLWSKDKLGIEADLYALKHTYLNDVTAKYGISQAKDLAGHTSEKTTRIYAVDFDDMILEQQKTIDVSLVVKG